MYLSSEQLSCHRRTDPCTIPLARHFPGWLPLTVMRDLMNSLLFSPITIRERTLRNRIVVSPMQLYDAVNGFPSDWHLVNIGRFAVGGAGLVFLESTKVHARGCSTPRDLGIWKDDFIAPLRRIADFVRTQGSLVGIQIAHSGRKAR